MRKFFQWPYVKRHFASKGIADIVAIKPQVQYFKPDSNVQYAEYKPGSTVAMIQCKSGTYPQRNFPKIKRQELIRYSQDCGAIPIFAYNEGNKIKLVDIYTNKEFVP